MKKGATFPWVDERIANLILGVVATPDAFALAYVVLAGILLTRIVENPQAARPSVFVLVQHHRREWMRRMAERDPRVVDAQLLAELRRGTAFFASTVVLALGAGTALLSNVAPLHEVLERLGLAGEPNIEWEIKIAGTLAFLAASALNFVWSHRAFGYLVVLFGAMHRPGHPDAHRQAERAAAIGMIAARSFRRGVQNLYLAGATMFWLLGPGALALAVTGALLILWSREYAPRTRHILSPLEPDDDPT